MATVQAINQVLDIIYPEGPETNNAIKDVLNIISGHLYGWEK